MAEFKMIEQQMMAKGMAPDQKLLFTSQLASTLKDRNTVLILSVILGISGIDRFYIGDIGMGLLKLFTIGGCGVLWLIDLFIIRGRVDDLNRAQAHEILRGIQLTSE